MRVIVVYLCLSLSPQITKQQLQQTKDRFQAFLNGDTQIVADEAFINAVQSYNEVRPHKYFVILGQERNALRGIIEHTVLILHSIFTLSAHAFSAPYLPDYFVADFKLEIFVFQSQASEQLCTQSSLLFHVKRLVLRWRSGKMVAEAFHCADYESEPVADTTIFFSSLIILSQHSLVSCI